MQIKFPSLLASPEKQAQLEQPYTEYFQKMFLVAVGVLRDEETAKDAVHDVFLRLVPHLDELDDKSPAVMKSYLATMTRNRAIDIIRRARLIRIDDLEEMAYTLEDKEVPPADQVISADSFQRLVGYLDRLSDTYRQVCRLHYLHGMKENEIAELLGIPQKTVNTRIFRGKKKLKEMIDSEQP